jgi:ketosteroid isomerase-like protein
MIPTFEAQIVEAEDRLRAAMLSSDVDSLEELLAPELMFTNHLGHLLGKEDDLAAYRSGMLKVKELTASEKQVRLIGEVAIVSVRMQLAGAYDGSPANGDFRFTRVWALSAQKKWRVIAAHVGRIARSNRPDPGFCRY